MNKNYPLSTYRIISTLYMDAVLPKGRINETDRQLSLL